MNKEVLIAIQPYWVFLIVAKKMGWDVPQEKTVEVRKSFPQDVNWNRKSLIYCSSNKQSFNRIPKKYQPFMAKLLGKVIGKFVCDEIIYLGNISNDKWDNLLGDVHDYHKRLIVESACLTEKELHQYGGKYAWRISNLIIYDKPKELSELTKPCNHENDCCTCDRYDYIGHRCFNDITRPPQSWYYVEE